MDDQNIYKELSEENQTGINKYEQNWGTLLNFLDESKLDEVTISKLADDDANVTEQYLKHHDLLDETTPPKRNRNMADIYDRLTNVPGRDTAVTSYQTASPNIDYVYKPKKKAVVMIRKKGNNTQIKTGEGQLDNSFYSQPGEKPTNISANMSAKGDSFGVGYKAMTGTPLPSTSTKAPLHVSRPKSIKRKNLPQYNHIRFL